MTRDEIVAKVMGLQAGPSDTFRMLQAVENIPNEILHKVVGVAPQGVYTQAGTGAPVEKVQQVETFSGIDSANTLTTTTGTTANATDMFWYNGTQVITDANVPTGHVYTLDPAYVSPPLPVPINDPAEPQYVYDGSTNDYHRVELKRKRKKKALSPPIKVQPRNPGARRIVLED